MERGGDSRRGKEGARREEERAEVKGTPSAYAVHGGNETASGGEMAAYIIALAFQLPPAQCALIRSNHRNRRWQRRKPHGGSSNPKSLFPSLSRLDSPSVQQHPPPSSVLQERLGAKEQSTKVRSFRAKLHVPPAASSSLSVFLFSYAVRTRGSASGGGETG
jgi:hypothetical protein